jgi:hypothetical protein
MTQTAPSKPAPARTLRVMDILLAVADERKALSLVNQQRSEPFVAAKSSSYAPTFNRRRFAAPLLRRFKGIERDDLALTFGGPDCLYFSGPNRPL